MLIVKPETPEVRCKQPAVAPIPQPPRADQWVEWLPPVAGAQQGTARLSETAARWIIETLAVAGKLRGLRAVEHDCLDAAEEAGLIRQ